MSRFSRVRPTLSFANVMSSIAVFVALGGTGYAAVSISGKDVKNSSLTGADVKNSSLTGSDVKNSSLTGADVKNSSLTGSDVKDGSLRTADFAAGQLPKGDKGDKGERGEKGVQGDKGDTALAGDGSPRLWGYIRDWARDEFVHPLPDVVGLGTLSYNCPKPTNTGRAILTFTSTVDSPVRSTATTFTGSTSTTVSSIVNARGTVTVDLGGQDATSTIWQLSPEAFHEAGSLTTLTITHSQYGAGCSIRAQALTQDPVRGQ